MDSSLEENVREWTIVTWCFLHNGTMPDEVDRQVYAVEALQWGARNRAVVERFAAIHGRRNIILLARTHTPQALAATKVADLWSIQTPSDRVAISKLLENDAEYKKLRRQGQGWENNPSYTAVRWVYFFFWPLGFLMGKLKERSHEAFLKAGHMEYVITDAYFRSLDADEDYIRQLQFLMDGYWANMAGESGQSQ